MYKIITRVIITLTTFVFSCALVSAYTTTSGFSYCPWTGWNTSWQKQIPVSNNTSAPTSGSFSCETHWYYGGYWTGWLSVGTTYSCPGDRYAWDIQFSWSLYRIYCKYVDDTPPSIDASDLGWFTPANNTYYVPIDYGVWQSWIWAFSASIEDYNNSSNTLPVSLSWNGFNLNMSLVDGSDRLSPQNYRPYSLSLNQVCDEAGNCISGLPNNYDYNVYAASIDNGVSSIWSFGNFSLWDIADGTSNNIDMELYDVYGNEIIPVPTIRTVTTYLDYDNSLYLDQYNLSWISWVDINGTPTNIWSNQLFTQVDSGNWEYSYDFQVYSPTSWYLEGEWDFRINSVYATISDVSWATSLSGGSSDFDFAPLYSTVFSGDIVNNSFLEWVTQSSNISVARNTPSWVVTSWRSLRTEFGEVLGSLNVANSRYNISLNAAPITEWNQPVWSNTTEMTTILPSSTNIDSLLSQNGTVFTSPDGYLASIIKYDIWSKTVVYPSDVIGKDSYHGSVLGTAVVQEWIKITGNTSSQSSQQITGDQFIDDVRILWKLTKSTFKKEIEKQVYSVLRRVTAKSIGSSTISTFDLDQSNWGSSKFSVGSSVSKWTSLFWDEVLYFGDGSTVTLSGASNIEWKKTIVVEDGDLYINGNIENTDNDGILWIIVINGDILINTTTVSDIHATMYTNRSIYSTVDWINRLDGSASFSQLANQLYIKWSIFSENTIWGSRKAIPECPYYIPSANCTSALEAQAYDLNYLRRYFMQDLLPAGFPDGTLDTPSWAQSRMNGQSWFEEFPVIIDYNPLIQQTPPPFFE